MEPASGNAADMIVIPGPVCQMNLEVCRDNLNKAHITILHVSVLYQSQLMSVAYGRSATDIGLHDQINKPKKLLDIAEKQVGFSVI